MGVDVDADADFLSRVSSIYDLPAQIRPEVAAFAFEDDTHVELLGTIEKASGFELQENLFPELTESEAPADVVHEGEIVDDSGPRR